MGGDDAPNIVVNGADIALNKYPNLKLIEGKKRSLRSFEDFFKEKFPSSECSNSIFLDSEYLNLIFDTPESIFDNIKSLVFCNYKEFTISTYLMEKLDNLCFDFVAFVIVYWFSIATNKN